MKDNLGKGNTNDAEHIDSVQLQFCWAQLAATAVEKNATILTDEQWIKYSMSQLLQMAQVFVSKNGSNIGCHVAQIFIDIHKKVKRGFL